MWTPFNSFENVKLNFKNKAIRRRYSMSNIIWTIITIMFVLWLVGLLTHIGGGLIHLVLVGAAILLVYNLVTKGRATL